MSSVIFPHSRHHWLLPLLLPSSSFIININGRRHNWFQFCSFLILSFHSFISSYAFSLRFFFYCLFPFPFPSLISSSSSALYPFFFLPFFSLKWTQILERFICLFMLWKRRQKREKEEMGNGRGRVKRKKKISLWKKREEIRFTSSLTKYFKW